MPERRVTLFMIEDSLDCIASLRDVIERDGRIHLVGYTDSIKARGQGDLARLLQDGQVIDVISLDGKLVDGYTDQESVDQIAALAPDAVLIGHSSFSMTFNGIEADLPKGKYPGSKMIGAVVDLVTRRSG